MTRQPVQMTAKLSILALALSLTCGPTAMHASPDRAVQADDPTPPASPVKLIFIHHSTGGHWLADVGQHDQAGGLGQALRDNNYFVSATNYGWGPDQIGSNTDIPNWPDWFTGSNRDTIVAALYAENEQNVCNPSSPSDDCFGTWSRLATDPGGANEIIMFKSCFPNSDLAGNPDDPPDPAPSGDYTVGNSKAVYNDILTYFATRQDKLFVVITAPPLQAGDTTPENAANARAFNNWLVNDWLPSNGYTHTNVAVFDYYNVLTSNGSAGRVDDPATNEELNDFASRPDGNHHYWNGSAIVHPQTIDNNYSAYPSASDDTHPTTAGQQKAAQEFVQLLNVFYNRWKGSSVQDKFVYLPVILKNYGQAPSGGLVQPADFVYLGAFRLPDDADRPRTFEYGGNAMTFNPSGDPTNADAYPGSLFIMGHDRIVGDVPDGNQVAEISIPEPAVSSNPGALNTAAFLQGFANVLAGHFTQIAEDIPRAGMAYLSVPATGPKLHVALGQHLPPEQPVPTHGWVDTHLSAPNFQGEWYIGDQSFDSINGYMFEIPAAWADANTSGRYLGTGRFRDGGWSGMGPALFAYTPWLPGGAAPVSGTHVAETTLLLYDNSRDNENIVHNLNNYQHPDEWEGGAWLTTSTGKTGVLFAGTKSNGTKYWYGWVYPGDPSLPCVEVELIGNFTLCRFADGTPCPAEDLTGCTDHNDYRGWWSTHFDAQFILYDPADLAQVAGGSMQSWEPQPYATMDVDEHLYFNPPAWDLDNLGRGDQRRSRIGDVAYDRAHDLLYVLELYGDEAKPMVHVWRVQ